MITVKRTEFWTPAVGDKLKVVAIRKTGPGRWEWTVEKIEKEDK